MGKAEPGDTPPSATVLTVNQVAAELQYRRAEVHALIRSGRLKVIDDQQPMYRWRVSRAELDRYVGGAK